MSKKSNRKKTSKKRQAMSSASNKRPIIILATILVAVGSYFFYFKGDRNPYAYRPDKAPLDIEALKGGETRSTLSPVSFVGNVARAYNVARENRELLDSIHCYCNCKETIGHKSLFRHLRQGGQMYIGRGTEMTAGWFWPPITTQINSKFAARRLNALIDISFRGIETLGP